MRKKWVVCHPDESLVSSIERDLNIPRLLAILLVNRNIRSSEEAKQFLDVTESKKFDPWKLKGMREAVDCLLEARDREEKVVIYGDYDVDGITGTTLLLSVFRDLGWKTDFYIPNRMNEGYGLNKGSIFDIFKNGGKTILTVDCGITSIEEVEYARFLGLKVVVTDHHEIKDKIPRANAVVDPKQPNDTYPFKSLAGVGVAYKLLQAIVDTLGVNYPLQQHLGLVALGTIADVVPILGENRFLVQKGLASLCKGRSVGVEALFTSSKVNPSTLDSTDVSFKIAPKLNAVGRLADASLAVKLFLSHNKEEAEKISAELVKYNSKRQYIEGKIFRDALSIIEEDPGYDEEKILVVTGEGWHPGVIGIVASKILSRYYKPVIVIATDSTDIARGSTRGIDGVNIMELLSAVSDLLIEYGGHAMAAGFTILKKDIEEFRKRINEVAEQTIDTELFSPSLYIDTEFHLSDINADVMEGLSKLSPYGHGNPEPTFLLKDMNIKSVHYFGPSSQHVLITLTDGKKDGHFTGFNKAYIFDDYRYIRPSLLKANVVFTPRRTEWMGYSNIQLYIKDIEIGVSDILKEEIEDKKFVFHMFDRWNPQDEKEGKTSISELEKKKRIHTIMKRMECKKLTKLMNKIENSIIILDVKGYESFIPNMLFSSKSKEANILVILPTTSILNRIYNLFQDTFSFMRYKINYCDSMNFSSWKNNGNGITFTNATVVSSNLELFYEKDFDEIIFSNYSYLYPIDRNGKFEIFFKYKPMFYIDWHSSKEIINYLQIKFGIKNLILNKESKSNLMIVDRRNVESKFEVLLSLISTGESFAIFTNTSSKSVKLAHKIGMKMKDAYQNGEIIFYNEKLSAFQKQKIISLIRNRKIKILVTTPSFPANLSEGAFKNLIYYDLGFTLGDILLPLSMIGKEQEAFLYLMYGENDVRETNQLINTIFPDIPFMQKVIDAVRELRMKSDGDISEERLFLYLKEQGIVKNKANYTVLKRTMEEDGVLKNINGKLNLIEDPFSKPMVSVSTRLKEGEVEKELFARFSRKMLQMSPRDLIQIIQKPIS
ncbi:MAG: single-stranded-DNA-specific exonuclease RecJ [Thermotogae bacterium]|nr:single-stranded-DNA-specific exonuclease RecJ [Thermotogota bacterium]